MRSPLCTVNTGSRGDGEGLAMCACVHLCVFVCVRTCVRVCVCVCVCVVAVGGNGQCIVLSL